MPCVVINTCYGGYGFSEKARDLFLRFGITRPEDLPRHDPRVIHVVETLGVKANGSASFLKVVTIKGFKYRIHEYDGSESIVTPEEEKYITIPKNDDCLLGKNAYSNSNNELWGKIISEEKNVYRLSNGRIAKKKTFGRIWHVKC